MRRTLASRTLWRALSLAGVVVLLALAFRFGADAGVVWDELLQVEYGERILRWFRSGFVDRSATSYEDLYLYGGLFEVIAQWIVGHSTLGTYETRHLLTTLLAVLAVVVTGATAQRIGGARAGFIAGLSLALTPAWIGHGLFNPKDVPFGALATLVLWASVRLATSTAPACWRDVTIASAAVGLTLAVRPGGIFVAALPVVGVVAAATLRSADEASPKGRVTASGRLAALGVLRFASTLPIAWALMLIAWPWAQLDPIVRPVQAIAAASHFGWDGVMLFAGTTVRSTALPASYLPTWFLVTTPEFYGVALLLGIAALAATWRSAARSGGATVLASIVIPLLGVFLTRPVLYDGLRHFLFLFPPLAVLAGLSLDRFLSVERFPLPIRAAGVVAFGVSAVLTARDIVALHPYQYVYFNRFSGGTAAAVGRYETDYWGASYQEGLAWVVKHVSRLREGGPTRVASCNDNSNRRLEYYRGRWPGVAAQIVIARDYAASDIFLAVTRYDCHKQPGQVLHVVERAGAPLLYVIRTEQP